MIKTVTEKQVLTLNRWDAMERLRSKHYQTLENIFNWALDGLETEESETWSRLSSRV